MVLCKNMYLAGLKPFGFDISENSNYAKLKTIAEELPLRHLYGFFLEHQYYMNLWAAIFILDKFKPALEETLVGLNDKLTIVGNCMEILKRHAEDFDTIQLTNYDVWIKKIKTHYHLT